LLRLDPACFVSPRSLTDRLSIPVRHRLELTIDDWADQ